MDHEIYEFGERVRHVAGVHGGKVCLRIKGHDETVEVHMSANVARELAVALNISSSEAGDGE